MTEKQLLEDIRHTLVSIGGLYAFDYKSERCVYHGIKRPKPMDKNGFDYDIVEKKYTVPVEELISLDFAGLIRRIDKELEK